MNKRTQLKEHVSSKTANNFQEVIVKIMTIVHGNDFIPTKQYGGDGGVDGRLLLEEKRIYYAIGGYSSTKDIEKKILSDAKKIKENVIKKKEWQDGDINEICFCFIVQTVDQPLPNSVQGRTNNFKNKLSKLLSDAEKQYEYKIQNGEMFIEDLSEIQINKVYDEIYNISNVFEAIEDFFKYVQLYTKEEYKRKSSEEKIKSNHMEKSRVFIENKILELDFVEALTKWQEDLENQISFDYFKEKVITTYNELSEKEEDKNVVLSELIKYFYSNTALTKENAGSLIIYIFDRCDIF